MKKINTRLDSVMSPLNSIAPWFFRIALGVAIFLHGYKKLPAPYMMEEQHRMVTWFESIFIPMPEVFVSIVILVEILGGVGIILGGLIGLFASQAGHFITRISAFFRLRYVKIIVYRSFFDKRIQILKCELFTSRLILLWVF